MKKFLFPLLTSMLLSCGGGNGKVNDIKDNGEPDGDDKELTNAFEVNGREMAIVSMGYSTFIKDGAGCLSFCLTPSSGDDIEGFYGGEKERLPEYLYLTIESARLGQTIDLSKTTPYWSCSYMKQNAAGTGVEKEFYAGTPYSITASGSLRITARTGETYAIALNMTCSDGNMLKANYEGSIGFYETKEVIEPQPANFYTINGQTAIIRSSLCVTQVSGSDTYYTLIFSPEEVYSYDSEAVRIELYGSDFGKEISIADGSVSGWKIIYEKFSQSGDLETYFSYDSDLSSFAEHGHLTVSEPSGDGSGFQVKLVVSDGDYLSMELTYSGQISIIRP